MNVKLFNDDCLNVLPTLQENCIGMVLCDLPYGVTRNSWDCPIDLSILWREYERLITDNGVIVLFGQGMFTASLMLSNKKMWRYNLIWKKGNRVSGFLNAKKMPLRNHEDIIIFYKSQPVYNPQYTEGIPLHGKGTSYLLKENTNNNYGEFKQLDDFRKGSTQKYPKSVLDFERPHPPIHPTQKPVSLLEYLIKTYTNEGETVLDNCMGSGSTGVACVNTNRKFIGIEKEEKYFKIAEERIKEASNNLNKFME